MTPSLLAQVQAGATTPPITRAMARWDGTITKEAMEEVNELRLRDLRGERSDGTGRFRGSLLGACPRMQLLSYTGYAGDTPTQTGSDIMKDGTYRHYLWQEAGLSAGFLDAIEYKVWSDELTFGGQLDGVMTADEFQAGTGGFELKTTNPTTFKAVADLRQTFKESGAFAVYRAHMADDANLGLRMLSKWLLQIGGYCEAGDFDWFSLVVEKRDYTMDWFEILVPYDGELQRLTRDNFVNLHGWKDSAQLPPVKEKYPADWECTNWCSFSRICPSATF